MTGAVALAGMAALRGGAGLVRLAVADRCLETVAGYEPSYMTAALPDDIHGRISGAAHTRIVELAQSATVVAMGPGLGRSPDLDRLVALLYQELSLPMVCDADALNALSTKPELLSHHAGPRVLTPHPGEFARLVGHKYPGEEREVAALELAGRCHVVVVLKGHRTFVTDGRRHWHNSTGNPGMATGGSGDSLTGLDHRPGLPGTGALRRRPARRLSARPGRRPGGERAGRNVADCQRHRRLSAEGDEDDGRGMTKYPGSPPTPCRWKRDWAAKAWLARTSGSPPTPRRWKRDWAATANGEWLPCRTCRTYRRSSCGRIAVASPARTRDCSGTTGQPFQEILRSRSQWSDADGRKESRRTTTGAVSFWQHPKSCRESSSTDLRELRTSGHRGPALDEG